MVPQFLTSIARVFPNVLLSAYDGFLEYAGSTSYQMCHEPDPATKHPQQNPRQANLSIRSCTSSARISTSAWSTSSVRLVVNSRAGHRPDDRPAWKRPRGRPRQIWIRQLEIDVGFTADAAWDMAGDRDVWRAQRPIAGQAVQWVSEWVSELLTYRYLTQKFFRPF